ncbi:MAG: DUF2764 family protein [Methylococcales bacterium]|nr:DUF2764 family protein [Methylococcales bacterium]
MMITGQFKYAMLMASLPAHQSELFSARQTPLSSIQLEKRLTWLEDHDAMDLRRIEELLFWSQINNASDEFICQKSSEVVRLIRDPFLKNILIWRLECRTLLSALRMRQAGLGKPQKNTFPGIGKWLDVIEKNWDKDDFGVARQVPWIIPVQQLLAQNESYQLEKFLLHRDWQYYTKACSQHYFDFPAVVIYVLRWDIINRWTLYQADQALKHFDELVDGGLNGLVLDF